MSVAVKFPEPAKYVFIGYVITLLATTNLYTAFCLIPMTLLAGHAIFSKPKALCVVGKDKDISLEVMAYACKELEIKEVHIFEAKSREEIEEIGAYFSDTDMLYGPEEDDDF